MACLKRPLINVAKRSYCAAGVVQEVSETLTKVSLVYNAGSRFEKPSNIGVTHAVRAALGWGSPGGGVDRKLLGYHSETSAMNVSVTTTREQLIYTIEGWLEGGDVSGAMQLLRVLTKENNFTRVNTDQNQFLANIKHDLAALAQSPALQFAEAAHKAAFGMGGLGNSLYMPSYAVGSHSFDMINDFMSELLVPSNGTFVLQNDIRAPTQAEEKADNKAKASPSPFTPSELRIEGANKEPIAGLLFEGASWSSKDRVALSVLAQALGTGTVAGPTPYETGVMNYNYSDTGLFGVYFSTNCINMGKVAESVAANLSKFKAGELTQADFDVAKAKASVATAHSDEHDVAVTSLKSAERVIAAELDAIKSVSLSQVQTVAKKVLGSEPSMVAVGDLRATPSLRNVKF